MMRMLEMVVMQNIVRIGMLTMRTLQRYVVWVDVIIEDKVKCFGTEAASPINDKLIRSGTTINCIRLNNKLGLRCAKLRTSLSS